jgi:hypothetical protein
MICAYTSRKKIARSARNDGTSVWSSRRSRTVAPSLPSTSHRPTLLASALPSPPTSGAAFFQRFCCDFFAGDYNQASETLHHQTNRGRHAVHLRALQTYRHHGRVRRPQRKPPHPSRRSAESTRRAGTPRAGDGFLARRSAAHLARLASEPVWAQVKLKPRKN